MKTVLEYALAALSASLLVYASYIKNMQLVYVSAATLILSLVLIVNTFIYRYRKLLFKCNQIKVGTKVGIYKQPGLYAVVRTSGTGLKKTCIIRPLSGTGKLQTHPVINLIKHG